MTRKKFFMFAFVVLAITCCCFTFTPAVVHTLDMNMHLMAMQSQLHQFALGFQSYYEHHKRLPPTVVLDKDGKPLYSWRVLMLPFFERQDLYNEFHLQEPWDSPHNLQFLEKMPSIYATAHHDVPPGTTTFQVIVGPNSAFERPGLKWEQFTDGLDQTILVIDAAEPVQWTKPVDVVYDPKLPVKNLFGVTKQHIGTGFLGLSRYKPVFTVAFADGQARIIGSPIDEKTLRALITRNGGEKVDRSKLGN